jgi:hypothetical protein
MKKRNDRLEFLYCPVRLGDSLHVERHRVVKEGPWQIWVDPIPDGWAKDGHQGEAGLVHIRRDRIEEGWAPRHYEGGPEHDLCPLGRFYLSEEGARFALQLWIGLRRIYVRPSRRRVRREGTIGPEYPRDDPGRGRSPLATSN